VAYGAEWEGLFAVSPRSVEGQKNKEKEKKLSTTKQEKNLGT